jgi:hypothetical protein
VGFGAARRVNLGLACSKGGKPVSANAADQRRKVRHCMTDLYAIVARFDQNDASLSIAIQFALFRMILLFDQNRRAHKNGT